MVTDNIVFLLNSFFRCSAYENVIFCWVMHQQEIIDGIAERLEAYRIKKISLICSPEALKKRLEGDIAAGIRQADILERSLARLPLYRDLSTEKIDVSGLSVEETAEKIINI